MPARPLPAHRADRKLDKGKRVLLDGHIRLISLRDLGYTEVACLESTDDESFTYNNRINLQADTVMREEIASSGDDSAAVTKK